MQKNLLSEEAQWKSFYKFFGVMAIVLFAFIPFQVAVYFISPPPKSVIEYFSLFQRNCLLGLLDLDLGLTIDNIIFMLVYIGLYAVMKRYNKPLTTTGLVFAVISTALYLVSREVSFSMISLSSQYTSAVSEAEKASIVTIGSTLLAIYNGTCFDISYVLGGVSIILFSIAMLKSDLFTEAFAWLGIIMGILMLVPPTMGKFGFVVSFISIIPLMPWLIIVGIRFFRLAKV